MGPVRGLFPGEAGWLGRLILRFVWFGAFLAVAIEFGIDVLMFGEEMDFFLDVWGYCPFGDVIHACFFGWSMI